MILKHIRVERQNDLLYVHLSIEKWTKQILREVYIEAEGILSTFKGTIVAEVPESAPRGHVRILKNMGFSYVHSTEKKERTEIYMRRSFGGLL